MASRAGGFILVVITLLSQHLFADEPQRDRLADCSTYLADLSAACRVPWPKNRTIRIVCHGHSVPAGYFKTPVVDTFNAYPHLLHQSLKKRFPNAVINVIVTAIGGETSDRGANRFEQDVLALRPDLVTIDYALNDRRLGLAAAKQAWAQMLRLAQDRGVPVLLLTPTGDTSADLEDPRDPLCQHAAQIRDLAEEFDVGLVDSLSVFQQHVRSGGRLGELMSQVNHPNRRGHDLVVQELLKWFP